MKKTFFIIMSAVIAAALLFVGTLFCVNNIGISSSGIEEDFRSSQKIEDDWNVEGGVGDSMAAFISYPQDKSDHTFSFYVKHTGLSFGYFFRAGGKIGTVEDSIMEITAENSRERAFISMNKQKAVKVEINCGDVQVIELDASEPFAFVLPNKVGTVIFYDSDGNTVEYISRVM